VENMSKHKAIKAREVAGIARDVEPGSVIRQKDFDNARQRLRLKQLDGNTSVQQFIHKLTTMGYKHRIQWAPDDPTRPVAFV
jgi:hypothetical protein